MPYGPEREKPLQFIKIAQTSLAANKPNHENEDAALGFEVQLGNLKLRIQAVLDGISTDKNYMDLLSARIDEISSVIQGDLSSWYQLEAQRDSLSLETSSEITGVILYAVGKLNDYYCKQNNDGTSVVKKSTLAMAITIEDTQQDAQQNKKKVVTINAGDSKIYALYQPGEETSIRDLTVEDSLTNYHMRAKVRRSLARQLAQKEIGLSPKRFNILCEQILAAPRQQEHKINMDLPINYRDEVHQLRIEIELKDKEIGDSINNILFDQHSNASLVRVCEYDLSGEAMVIVGSDALSKSIEDINLITGIAKKYLDMDNPEYDNTGINQAISTDLATKGLESEDDSTASVSGRIVKGYSEVRLASTHLTLLSDPENKDLELQSLTFTEFDELLPKLTKYLGEELGRHIDAALGIVSSHELQLIIDSINKLPKDLVIYPSREYKLNEDGSVTILPYRKIRLREQLLTNIVKKKIYSIYQKPPFVIEKHVGERYRIGQVENDIDDSNDDLYHALDFKNRIGQFVFGLFKPETGVKETKLSKQIIRNLISSSTSRTELIMYLRLFLELLSKDTTSEVIMDMLDAYLVQKDASKLNAYAEKNGLDSDISLENYADWGVVDAAKRIHGYYWGNFREE